jgi:ferredoxin
MANCKKYNSMKGGALYSEGGEIPYEFHTPERIWDASKDLTSKTLNIIKAYKQGTGLNKDIETDGYSFCRYCQIACPFNIPKFEWDKPFPEIRKCQFCNHRYEEGGYAACCEFCPTGASIFGKVVDLREEAKKRLTLEAGSSHNFPVQRVDASETLPRPVSKYVNHIYGLNEVGGTQYLMLAGVPFAKLGLPTLGEKAPPAVSEGITHTVYKGMIAPGVVLLGLVIAAYQGSKDRD